mmetsp:Transcript_19729/g.29062  ORF Transcript_19729/g.29062 Transcript_19729/m.29062 type:complete len:252 (-) Transcript_19729:554-1309(-)
MRDVKSFDVLRPPGSRSDNAGPDQSRITDVGTRHNPVVHDAHDCCGSRQAAVDTPGTQHLALNVEDGLSESLGRALGERRVTKGALGDAGLAVRRHVVAGLSVSVEHAEAPRPGLRILLLNEAVLVVRLHAGVLGIPFLGNALDGFHPVHGVDLGRPSLSAAPLLRRVCGLGSTLVTSAEVELLHRIGERFEVDGAGFGPVDGESTLARFDVPCRGRCGRGRSRCLRVVLLPPRVHGMEFSCNLRRAELQR